MKWHTNIGTAPLLLLITERRRMQGQREGAGRCFCFLIRINLCINSNCNGKRVHYLTICTLIGRSVIQIIGVGNIRIRLFFYAAFLHFCYVELFLTVFLAGLFIKKISSTEQLIGESSIGHGILLLYANYVAGLTAFLTVREIKATFRWKIHLYVNKLDSKFIESCQL